MFKFDSSEYSTKFGELEKVLGKEDFVTEAKTMKSFIDELKLSMVNIYRDYRLLNEKK